MQRSVLPEILDSLAPDDPRAIRSRRDLRLIDAVMGNDRWLLRQIRRLGWTGRIVETGAGDGRFARKLARAWKGAEGAYTGIDLAPAPPGLPGTFTWIRGDLRHVLLDVSGKMLVANLILHHFDDGELRALGPSIRNFDTVLLVEPWRSPWTCWSCQGLFPFVNEVTRHDMRLSIRAGFQPGELTAALELNPEAWQIEERVTLLGAYRLRARRK